MAQLDLNRLSTEGSLHGLRMCEGASSQRHRAWTPRLLRHALAVGLLGLLTVLLASTSVLAQSYVYQSGFGSTGSGNGQFLEPVGVAIDPTTHDIVIVDAANHRLQIFSSTGLYLAQFGSIGTGLGQFQSPGWVAIDPGTHNIIVTDSGDARVTILTSAGGYLSQFGATGTGTGQFSVPFGVAIDPSTHNIVVADGVLNRVQIFTSAGDYLSQFGSTGSGTGQFLEPVGVAIDAGTHNIVVADLGNNRVQIFNSSGVYQSEFGSAGTGNGQFVDPTAVAIDPSTHNIIVTDAANSRVQIFTPAGGYLSQFGSHGAGNGQFLEPDGVAIEPATLNIVVADAASDRVEIFEPSGSSDVIEYYDAHDDLYFITASLGEAAAIDSGVDNVGPSIWTRTGYSFNAYGSPGPGNNVCRFYDPNIPPVGIHFYTALPAECANVQATLPAWYLETAAAFNIELPVNGTCAAGFVPVYRYYDKRPNQSWRFITDASVYAAMLSMGWVYEGVQMCSPQ